MSRATAAARAIWSRPTAQRLFEILRRTRPDVAHFHNTFILISPSAYYACRRAGVPVVQTLHNYRLLCPAATFVRRGRVCEDCLGLNVPWPGLRHACYRSSRAETLVVAMMLAVHRQLKTWDKQVDLYVSLTEFCRRKFVEGGLPEEKIVVKPNFVSVDPGRHEGKGEYALYVGRLAPEKGVWTLLRAWKELKTIPLKIVGDGSLRDQLMTFARTEKLSAVEWLGQRPNAETLALMRRAAFLIFPSEWYETFGRVAIEAFGCGLPVIASRLGAMEEIVKDRETGLLFNPGEPADLVAKIIWMMANTDSVLAMRENARRAYEEKYTAAQNYKTLLEIYEKAMERAQQN